ncbi:MAG: hypothetical protein Q8R69_16450 [Telluria sp.]|nr:hypothetical protein [Telluria sp.]
MSAAANSQARKPHRLATWILIAALLGFPLWLIGVVAHSKGYCIRYGSQQEAATTLSMFGVNTIFLRSVRSMRAQTSEFSFSFSRMAA